MEIEGKSCGFSMLCYELSDEDSEILAPHPNAPNKDRLTPLYWAEFNSHTEIVKILVPLTDNPNIHMFYIDNMLKNLFLK